MHDFDLDLWNMPRSTIHVPIKRPNATFYVLTIAMYVISVSQFMRLSHIYELSNVRISIEYLTLKMKIKGVDNLYEN